MFVGHTHEDVDAGFGHISRHLKVTDVETYDQLLQLLPDSMALESMYDIKTWLEPHLSTPQHHTQPLHFRFKYVNDNTVKVQYKGLHDHPWEELEPGFFKSFENGKKYMPTGKPKRKKPDFENIDFSRMKKQIRSIEHLFSDAESGLWWNDFFNKIAKSSNQHQEWILDTLPRQTIDEHTSESCDAVPAPLQVLLDKELEKPKVSVNLIL